VHVLKINASSNISTLWYTEFIDRGTVDESQGQTGWEPPDYIIAAKRTTEYKKFISEILTASDINASRPGWKPGSFLINDSRQENLLSCR